MAKHRKKGCLLGKRKSVHPSDAFRKRLRKKEIKRNKEQREERRNKNILSKDENTLRSEINKFTLLDQKGKLEPRFKTTLDKLKEALNNILKAKKQKEKLRDSGVVKGLQKIVKRDSKETKRDSLFKDYLTDETEKQLTNQKLKKYLKIRIIATI